MSKKTKYFVIRMLALVIGISLGLTCGVLIGKANPKIVKEYIEVPVVVEKIIEVEKEEEKSLGYKQIDVVATAYCPCEECSEGYGTMTATGVTATEGRTIAVDPKVIPYGTNVLIDDKLYVAEDCGGLIKGNKIDIYFDCHSKVEKFGKQNLTVCVLEE
jgi:3D (Asp-Asp-Asp) domain-containing protein